jgi:hypothetical protein
MHFYLPGAVTGIDPVARELVMPIGDSELNPVDIDDIARTSGTDHVRSCAGHFAGHRLSPRPSRSLRASMPLSSCPIRRSGGQLKQIAAARTAASS